MNSQLSGFSLLIFLIYLTKIYFSELLGYIDKKDLNRMTNIFKKLLDKYKK